MSIIAELGRMKESDPADEAAQAQVEKLQKHISDHYYASSDEILSSLGRMYVRDGRFKKNIDNAGGRRHGGIYAPGH